MLASQIPAKVPLPFANSGTKNAIPTASQIGITAGAASLTDGFPPLTFTPLASGGVPPAGADFNGIFNMITAVQQWQCAGGIFKYDATFSTSIGGYPKGATLCSTGNDGYWLNLVDNNATNPDAVDGSAANWAPVDTYGTTTISGLTNANVTLTPLQSRKSHVTLAGTLTGNVQIIFPTTEQLWQVENNTTGAFTVTLKTAAGTGVIIPQGSGQQLISGDGTNLVQVVSAPNASTTVKGIARLATLAETTTGTDATIAVTPAGLAALGLKFGGIVAAAVNTTWTQATAAGKYIYITAAGATTQTFPLASTFGPGQSIAYFNNGSGTPTFARQGSDGVLGVMGGGTSFVLNQTEAVILTTDGSSWFCNFLNGATGLVLQTQQDLTASRAVSTTYTNSTGRPIWFDIQVTLTTGQSTTLIKNGLTAQTAGNTGASSLTVSVGSQVLPGGTYSLTISGGSIVRWMENR